MQYANAIISLHTGIGHAGGPLWTDWFLDPVAFASMYVSALFYTTGLVRSGAKRRRLHPWWRPALFYTGLAILLLALMSPLDYLSDQLLTAHMVQHLLITTVAVPFILLGAPMIPILRGMPLFLRQGVIGTIARNKTGRIVLRTITHPVVAWIANFAIFTFWHMPPMYDWTLRNNVVHQVEHVMFTAGAILFWWNLIDPVPLKPNLSYLGRIVYAFFAMVPTFLLGAALALSTTPLYQFYVSRTARYGLDPLSDQGIAGLLMWISGLFIMMGVMALLLALHLRKEEQEQERHEAAELHLTTEQL